MKRVFGYLGLVSSLVISVPYLANFSYSQAYPSAGGSSGNPGSSAGSTVMLQTMNGPNGEYLVDGRGRSVYLYFNDHQNSNFSNCIGACADVWPPVSTPNGQTPIVGGDAQSSLVGTLQRNDGSTQLTYNGWPIYYYSLDQKPGDTNGQGINSFGNVWYLLTQSGMPLIPPGAYTPPSGGYAPPPGGYVPPSGGYSPPNNPAPPRPSPSMSPYPGPSMSPHPGPSMSPYPGPSMSPYPGPSMSPYPGPSMSPYPGPITSPTPGGPR